MLVKEILTTHKILDASKRLCIAQHEMKIMIMIIIVQLLLLPSTQYILNTVK